MRISERQRETKETKISVKINLDGKGVFEIDTPYGFLTHMLQQLSKHSGIDMKIKATGDTEVDPHHTVEDTAIALGEALNEALGDRTGLERYGSVMLPMDETRCDVCIDLSGRAYLVYDVSFPVPWNCDEDFDYSLIKEFMKAVTENIKAAVHIKLAYGDNNHHIAEAVFKGFARALKQAVRVSADEIPSTKGII